MKTQDPPVVMWPTLYSPFAETMATAQSQEAIAGAIMPVEIERNLTNRLRFYITLPESEVPAVRTRNLDLRIVTTQRLLTDVKKAIATAAAKIILTDKLKAILPTGRHGDVKPYHVKRSKAGAVPQHYRVGIQITFAESAHADAFAQTLKIR